LLSWFGIFAPPQTPKPIVDRLYTSIRKALNNPDFKARLNDEGLDTIESTPERFTKLFKSDIVFWQKFIKENDIKLD
jgi:tripartite-type tricarboxylate transporter receptor subunit TctC